MQPLMLPAAPPIDLRFTCDTLDWYIIGFLKVTNKYINRIYKVKYLCLIDFFTLDINCCLKTGGI
jgi:hypothetical protein